RVGEVGEQVDIDIERDEEGFVLGCQDFAQEACAGVLFERLDVGLASAGVQQDSDRQGQVLLLCQALDDLRIVILGHLAVVFSQASDEAALVANREVNVDQVD